VVRQRLLLILVVALLPIACMVPEAAHASDADCTTGEALAGTCSTGAIAGDHVDVTAHTGSNSDDGTATDDSSGGVSDAPTDDAPVRPPHDPNAIVCDRPELCPTAAPQPDDALTPPPSPAAISMSDLAAFYPRHPTISGEPNGWAVVGLDTNFVSDATVHTVQGRLLNGPASVRFTPTRFEWVYGDGARATTSTPGRTWAELGAAEFSPTATSHVYSRAGDYDVGLTVVYTAQYRLGNGAWLGVPGTLSLRAPTMTVTASNATTVLVQSDCRTDPSGPGC
jgi:hypothetical protein